MALPWRRQKVPARTGPSVMGTSSRRRGSWTNSKILVLIYSNVYQSNGVFEQNKTSENRVYKLKSGITCVCGELSPGTLASSELVNRFCYCSSFLLLILTHPLRLS